MPRSSHLSQTPEAAANAISRESTTAPGDWRPHRLQDHPSAIALIAAPVKGPRDSALSKSIQKLNACLQDFLRLHLPPFPKSPLCRPDSPGRGRFSVPIDQYLAPCERSGGGTSPHARKFPTPRGIPPRPRCIHRGLNDLGGGLSESQPFRVPKTWPIIQVLPKFWPPPVQAGKTCLFPKFSQRSFVKNNRSGYHDVGLWC